jgi:uncharacterized protein YdhG (YjbR/CyaY superfamily)
LAQLEIAPSYYLSMKKSAARVHDSTQKKTAAPKTVDEYFAAVPEPARSTLNKVRATIRSVVPAETREVISYGMPGFKYRGMLMWYAAFSDHCSLFPTASVIEKFKEELKPFTTSKGTIHFPVNKPLPTALVKKIAKMRVAELEAKTRR